MSYEAPDKFFNSLYAQLWASLVVQWLKKKVCLPMQEMWVQSLG